MRDVIRLVVVCVALATAACGGLRGDSTPLASQAAGATAAPPAPDPAPPAAASAIYADDLRPLLQERCGRCHFPGGKMHARLPFDDEATVRELGAQRLFTRIEDDDGRRVVRSYFDALPR